MLINELNMGLRQNKIADQIFSTLSELLYNEVRDPRVQNIYLTAVKISADLQISSVYFMFKTTPSDINLTHLNQVNLTSNEHPLVSNTAENNVDANSDDNPKNLKKNLEENFDGKKSKAIEGLTACSGFFKKHLRSVLYVKRLPDFRFYYDHSYDRGTKISNIIDSLHGNKQ